MQTRPSGYGGGEGGPGARAGHIHSLSRCRCTNGGGQRVRRCRQGESKRPWGGTHAQKKEKYREQRCRVHSQESGTRVFVRTTPGVGASITHKQPQNPSSYDTYVRHGLWIGGRGACSSFLRRARLHRRPGIAGTPRGTNGNGRMAGETERVGNRSPFIPAVFSWASSATSHLLCLKVEDAKTSLKERANTM